MTHLITRRWVLAGGVLMALANCRVLQDAAETPHPGSIEPMPPRAAPRIAPNRDLSTSLEFDEYTW
jgi:hypothetical protein